MMAAGSFAWERSYKWERKKKEEEKEEAERNNEENEQVCVGVCASGFKGCA